jgi:hypothetical protein
MKSVFRLLLVSFLCIGCLMRGASAQETPPPAESDMRFVNGALTLKVSNFDEAREAMLEAARAEGAELLDAKTLVTPNGRRHGWLRLRLSVERLSVFLATARRTGIPYAENISSRNNRSEYDSLGRRTQQLRKHQTRLDGLLKSNRRLRGSDILYIQERLFRAEVDESLLEQRQVDVARQARVSIIQINLFEPVPIGRMNQARVDLGAHFQTAQQNATGALSRFTGRITTAVAYAVVFAPLWGPVVLGALLLILLLWRWIKRTGAVEKVWDAILVVFTAITSLTHRFRERIASEIASKSAPTVPATTEEGSEIRG